MPWVQYADGASFTGEWHAGGPVQGEPRCVDDIDTKNEERQCSNRGEINPKKKRINWIFGGLDSTTQTEKRQKGNTLRKEQNQNKNKRHRHKQTARQNKNKGQGQGQGQGQRSPHAVHGWAGNPYDAPTPEDDGSDDLYANSLNKKPKKTEPTVRKKKKKKKKRKRTAKTQQTK